MNKIYVTKTRFKSLFLAPLLVALPLIAVADFSVSVKPLSSRVAASPSANPTSTSWEVLQEDTTAQKVLARWAERSGWSVIWRGPDEVPMKGQGTLTYPDFLSAADHVMNTARAQGFKLKAVAHSNNVLVITKGD